MRAQRSLTLVAVWITSCAASLQAQELGIDIELKVSETSGMPLVYAYHGMLVNHELVEIPRSDRNMLVLLRAFSTAALETADEKVLEKYTALRSRARAALPADLRSDLALEAGLLGWLLERTTNEQKGLYQRALRPILAWGGFDPDVSPVEKFREDAPLLDSLQDLGLAPTDSKKKPKKEEVSYIQKCRKAGVPIPPNWGSKQWLFQDRLDSKFTFAGDPSNITEVWAYADANVAGTCIALPRRDQTTKEIGLLGIICQGIESGKACFWDNIDKMTGKRLTGKAGESFRIDSVQDGSNVAENCTNCHRGYNVFMIHPGTALDIGDDFDIDPVQRYEPISGQDGWGNPGPMIVAGTRPCGSCHEIPEFGNENNTDPTMPSAFCRIIEQAADKTMPSIARPAGWEKPDPRYAPHIDLFRTKCEGE